MKLRNRPRYNGNNEEYYEIKADIIVNMICQVMHLYNMNWVYDYQVVDNEIQYEHIIINGIHKLNVTGNDYKDTLEVVAQYIKENQTSEEYEKIQGFSYLNKNVN